MDALEELNMDRTNAYFYHYGSCGRGLGTCKASLSSPPPPPPKKKKKKQKKKKKKNTPFTDRSKAVLSLLLMIT